MSGFSKEEKEILCQTAKIFRNTCYRNKGKCISCPLSDICDLLDYSSKMSMVADALLKL